MILIFDTEAEKDAFEKIYQNNAALMYRIAMGIMKNKAQAEDAVSEAFLSLAEHSKKYLQKNESELSALCVTIVKNKCLSQLRRDKRISDKEIDKLFWDREAEDFVPEQTVIRNEEQKMAGQMLNQLPEVYHEALLLRYYYDYSPREIARLLSVSVRTVNNRLYQAKKIIRRLADEKDR